MSFDFYKVLKCILSRKGYAVETAENGEVRYLKNRSLFYRIIQNSTAFSSIRGIQSKQNLDNTIFLRLHTADIDQRMTGKNKLRKSIFTCFFYTWDDEMNIFTAFLYMKNSFNIAV